MLLIDMHLYSSDLPTIAIVSSSIFLKFLPACFSCSNYFILPQSSLKIFGENYVEIAVAIIAGDLSNSARDIFLLLFRPMGLILKLISFPNS